MSDKVEFDVSFNGDARSRVPKLERAAKLAKDFGTLLKIKGVQTSGYWDADVYEVVNGKRGRKLISWRGGVQVLRP